MGQTVSTPESQPPEVSTPTSAPEDAATPPMPEFSAEPVPAGEDPALSAVEPDSKSVLSPPTSYEEHYREAMELLKGYETFEHFKLEGMIPMPFCALTCDLRSGPVQYQGRMPERVAIRGLNGGFADMMQVIIRQPEKGHLGLHLLLKATERVTFSLQGESTREASGGIAEVGYTGELSQTNFKFCPGFLNLQYMRTLSQHFALGGEAAIMAPGVWSLGLAGRYCLDHTVISGMITAMGAAQFSYVHKCTDKFMFGGEGSVFFSEGGLQYEKVFGMSYALPTMGTLRTALHCVSGRAVANLQQPLAFVPGTCTAILSAEADLKAVAKGYSRPLKFGLGLQFIPM